MKILRWISPIIFLFVVLLCATNTGCAVSSPTTQQSINNVQTAFQDIDAVNTLGITGWVDTLNVLWAAGKISPAKWNQYYDDTILAEDVLYAYRQVYPQATSINDVVSVKFGAALVQALAPLALDVATSSNNPTGVNPGAPPIAIPVPTGVGQVPSGFVAPPSVTALPSLTPQ